jgi:glutamate-1-semialdehyde 2,1-aminomutase
LGEFARKELGRTLDDAIVTGKGSLFMTHFAKDGITEIKNSADAAKCDVGKLQKYHFKMIAHDGIFFLPGKLGAISNAHDKTDIKKMILASEKF